MYGCVIYPHRVSVWLGWMLDGCYSAKKSHSFGMTSGRIADSVLGSILRGALVEVELFVRCFSGIVGQSSCF